MPNKSINASGAQETAIIDNSECDFVEECTRDFGGCGINICFKAGNAPATGITSQDSIEKAIL